MIYVYPETRRVGGSGNGPRTRVIRERVVIRDSKRIGRLQVEQDGTLFWHPEGPSPLAAGFAPPKARRSP